MTEKQPLPATERETMPVKDDEYVDVEIIGVTVLPLRRLAPPRTHQEASPDEGFETGEEFEGVLDKVSRPVKGKYANILPSSEEFIKDKRTEVELEERSS